MNRVDLRTFNFSNSRKELRSEVINLFLTEEPGTGKGDLCSKYEYITKTLNCNENVLLKRPAQFNNGFDFTVHVSNINFNVGGRVTTRPTHQNILDDLLSKKVDDNDKYQLLLIQISLIYNCLEPTTVNIAFVKGYDVDLLLECIKWLFIEQDVTYWNYSGRNMTWGLVPDK